MSEAGEMYMCGVDYQEHLQNDSWGTRLYPSIEELRAHRKCVESCGIVAVRVEFVRWVQEQNLCATQPTEDKEG